EEQETSLRWLSRYLSDPEAAKSEAKLKEFGEKSHNLYQWLLGGLLPANDTSIHQLYVIADAALNKLPFELLLATAPDGKAATWPYLLHQTAISYLWTLDELLKTTEISEGQRLLLANTNYKNLPAIKE